MMRRQYPIFLVLIVGVAISFLTTTTFFVQAQGGNSATSPKEHELLTPSNTTSTQTSDSETTSSQVNGSKAGVGIFIGFALTMMVVSLVLLVYKSYNSKKNKLRKIAIPNGQASQKLRQSEGSSKVTDSSDPNLRREIQELVQSEVGKISKVRNQTLVSTEISASDAKKLKQGINEIHKFIAQVTQHEVRLSNLETSVHNLSHQLNNLIVQQQSDTIAPLTSDRASYNSTLHGSASHSTQVRHDLEDWVVHRYNHQPNELLGYKIATVTETKESQEDRWVGKSKIPVFCESLQGDYWVLQIDNRYCLVPKENIKLNQHNYESLKALYDCQSEDYSLNIRLIQTATAVPLGNNIWQLEHKGVLSFN